jgi:RNA polymerase sigma-70 factor (ECF subfamily)
MGAEVTVEQAIDRVLAGDAGAFRHIVAAYEGRLLSFCRSRLGSEDEARDAAQDVLVRAWSALPGFQRGKSFSAWLFAIAANRVRSEFRFQSFARRKTEAAGKELAALPPADPAEEVADRLRFEELRQAVATLKGELRSTVELFYFGGLSVSETSTALGIGEEAVKSRLFRARKQLREMLEKTQPKGLSRSNLS